MAKIKYRGFSRGSWYYVFANTLPEAMNLLRAQALRKVGKFDFVAYQKNILGKWENCSS